MRNSSSRTELPFIFTERETRLDEEESDKAIPYTIDAVQEEEESDEDEEESDEAAVHEEEELDEVCRTTSGGIRDGKGKILQKTGPLITELSRMFPYNSYTSFCHRFSVGFDEAQEIPRIQNLGSQENALTKVWNRWLNGGKKVTRRKLESALENIETRGRKSITKKPFAKAAVHEEEESDEDDEESDEDEPSGSRSKRAPKTKTTQKGSTLTIIASGNAKVEGNSVTGSVINMTNNYAAGKKRKVGGKRSGTKWKSNDSSPGPSTSQEKKKCDQTTATTSKLQKISSNHSQKISVWVWRLDLDFPPWRLYKAQNHAHGNVTYEGTKQMFIDWRDDEGQGKPAILKKALVKAKFALLA